MIERSHTRYTQCLWLFLFVGCSSMSQACSSGIGSLFSNVNIYDNKPT